MQDLAVVYGASYAVTAHLLRGIVVFSSTAATGPTVSDVGITLDQLAPSERTFPGYLFWLSRPRFWLYLAGPVLVGVVYAASSPAELFTPLSVALFLYFLVPANIYLYGINDIFDADIDELNPKKSEEGRELQYDGSHAVAGVVIGSGMLGLVFVPFLPLPAVVGLFGFLVLGTVYSVPPLRLKTTPVLDSVSNGLYIMPAIVAYAALAGAFPPALAVAGGWLWAMGMHTFSAIPDIEPDRKGGIETTATLFGPRLTLGYCGACWLFATLLMTLLHPVLGAVFLAYPLFIVFISLADVDIERAYWWFPVLNTVTGAMLTLGGLWRILHV